MLLLFVIIGAVHGAASTFHKAGKTFDAMRKGDVVGAVKGGVKTYKSAEGVSEGVC